MSAPGPAVVQPQKRRHQTPRGVRLIAALEAAKAVLVLTAGFGLLELVHRDLHDLAAHLISRLHLNPANKYPRIFLDAAAHVTNLYLWSLATLAFMYALFRAIEAYGLWHDRSWAAWLAVTTGGIYLPFEVYELAHRVTWIRAGALLVNLFVVIYLGYQVILERRSQREALNIEQRIVS